MNYLTVEQAAGVFNVSEHRIHSLLKQGAPHLQFGDKNTSLRIPQENFEAWLHETHGKGLGPPTSGPKYNISIDDLHLHKPEAGDSECKAWFNLMVEGRTILSSCRVVQFKADEPPRISGPRIKKPGTANEWIPLVPSLPVDLVEEIEDIVIPNYFALLKQSP